MNLRIFRMVHDFTKTEFKHPKGRQHFLKTLEPSRVRDNKII